MKKIFFILPLVIVSAFGFFLNGNYYFYYFESSGYPGLMPVLMSLFFISSELILWSFSSNKNAVSIILKYGLVLFSVVATLSSQYNSTSEKESDSEIIVFEKIDHSSTISHYLNQIAIQDDRINAIFEERKEKSYYGLTDDEMNFAQDEKTKYEKLLYDLQNKNEIEIKDVYKVDSIYAWFAVDLPRIASSGLNEEFIRVIFQLFSSLILAAMSPVCISLVRTYKPDNKKSDVKRKPKKTRHKKYVFPKIKIPTVKIPKIKLPAIKKIHASEPEPMKRTSASNIVKMILSGDNGLMSPVIACEEFLQHPERESKKLIYSLEDCRTIYDFIVSSGLENKNKDEILEAWNERSN